MNVEDNWPFESIVPNEDEAIYDLLVAYETQLDRVDVQADELMEQRFLDKATTDELEKLANEVGTVRETNEDDERLRFRARVSKAATRSDGTTRSFAEVLYAVFGEDVKDFTIDTVSGEPVVRITMPSDVTDAMPITVSELENELLDIIPTADGLEIITDDVWLLGESGSQGIGEGELT
jgi:hypothetical protein